MIHAPWLFKFILRDYLAIMIYPLVFYKEKNPSKFLINHERIHIEQVRLNGYFYFHFTYLWDYLINRFRYGFSHSLAYIKIRWEIEAYANQENFNYKPNSRFKK